MSSPLTALQQQHNERINNMKRASNRFFTVAIVFDYIFFILFLALAVFFILLGTPLCKEWVVEFVENEGTYKYFYSDPVLFFQIVFVSVGVVIAIFSPVPLVAAILTPKAKKDGAKRGLFIALIILNAISGNGFGIAAGILGLIDCKRKNNRFVDNNFPQEQTNIDETNK